MTTTLSSRRGFIKGSAAATGTVLFGFHIPFLAPAHAQGAVTPEINAWVVIKPDDTVVVRIARSEMGQGTLTGLAQLVAEELECDWSKVTTEYPTPGQNLARARVWGNFSTGGSRGIRESQEYVRKGGAAARMMLVQAAAQEWNVPVSECTAANSVVTHTASGRKAGYGKLAPAAAKVTPPAAAGIALKDPATWKIIGKPLARLDTAEKTNGKLVYGMDLRMPGMLNASVKACPVYGGKVRSFDASAALAMPGVKKVLQVRDNAVAVVADTWWRANKALAAVKIDWDNGANATASSAQFETVLRAGLESGTVVDGNRSGDAAAAIKGAARTLDAIYSYPHQNHACMETMNATVRWTPEKCEVWTPTQNGEAAHAVAAEAAGLPLAQCDIYKLPLGGGFGRRGLNDWVGQAVLIAKSMPGTPIKLIWSREEDMAQGRFHPVTMCKLTAGLDKDGKIDGLHMRISGQSILAGVFPQNIRNGVDPVVFQGLNAAAPEAQIGYTFPHLLVEHAMRNPHVPPGFWRGVNLNQNAIYLECFIDEIAHATKKDPLALRRELMSKHPKHLAVLNAVANKIGWDRPAAPGVFRGLAQTSGFGSYVAACAEVSVSAAGALKIHRIVAATDCGYAVNPQQIEAQVEGSFVYGLSAMLYQACTVKDGRMEQENFNTYPVMRMDEMPKVETVLVPTGGFWGGVGEPTIAVAAPAVLNAIFAATGKRIRDLPLSRHSLKKA
jgi:isoquinoline 1-oxidoreductase subunit beta